MRDFNQYFVATPMPLCIVNRFKIIQVDKPEGRHTVAPCFAYQFQPGEKRMSIRQASERVVKCLMPRATKQRSLLSHILCQQIESVS